MPLSPVVVTGVGPVSAIGCGRNEFWDSLVNGRDGFGPITLCDASESPSKIGAEVSGFALEDFVAKGHIMGRRTPRAVQLALASAVLALHDAEIDLDSCDADRFGVYVGTSMGNIDVILSLNARLIKQGNVPAHAAFHAFNHSAACVISSFFNIRGPIQTATSGCNSGIDAVGQATRMIQAGAVDAMLVIGTDCELVSEVLAAMNASNSLTTRYNDDPSRASRPWDKGRDGNVIGEGAAGLLLESESHARSRNARIYASVKGYQVSSAGQNRQYSHDSPEIDIRPCVRAMKAAMAEARWDASEVDLVNANGSSSVLYDKLEGLAMAEVFGNRLSETRIHSQKSMMGQHGAGSSALQAVGACLSIRRGTAPPTINCDDPDPECGPLRISGKAETFWPERVLVHSIGLGGFYYSAAAFEAVEDSGSMQTGAISVKWSDEKHPIFQPTEEFQKPLTPWEPRRD